MLKRSYRNVCSESTYGQIGYVAQSEILMSTVPAVPVILNIMRPPDCASPKFKVDPLEIDFPGQLLPSTVPFTPVLVIWKIPPFAKAPVYLKHVEPLGFV